MSEFLGGYMYASVAALPPIYLQRAPGTKSGPKPKKDGTSGKSTTTDSEAGANADVNADTAVEGQGGPGPGTSNNNRPQPSTSASGSASASTSPPTTRKLPKAPLALRRSQSTSRAKDRQTEADKERDRERHKLKQKDTRRGFRHSRTHSGSSASRSSHDSSFLHPSGEVQECTSHRGPLRNLLQWKHRQQPQKEQTPSEVQLQPAPVPAQKQAQQQEKQEKQQQHQVRKLSLQSQTRQKKEHQSQSPQLDTSASTPGLALTTDEPDLPAYPYRRNPATSPLTSRLGLGSPAYPRNGSSTDGDEDEEGGGGGGDEADASDSESCYGGNTTTPRATPRVATTPTAGATPGPSSDASDGLGSSTRHRPSTAPSTRHPPLPNSPPQSSRDPERESRGRSLSGASATKPAARSAAERLHAVRISSNQPKSPPHSNSSQHNDATAFLHLDSIDPSSTYSASHYVINPFAVGYSSQTFSVIALTQSISPPSSPQKAGAAMANISNPSLDAASAKGSSTGISSYSSSSRPFTFRSGRSFLADPTLPYPLPVDLAELHRQSLRTLLLIQVFGAPICSPVFSARPPARVLEVGCGSGFWSMMCHRYFANRGHSNISFTGVDIAPLSPHADLGGGGGSSGLASGSSSGSGSKPDPSMKWRFVQHDLRQLPWPFPDGEFDLVMVKDLSLAMPSQLLQPAMDEYLRLLRPGGVLEMWESDHQIRMLRPHNPTTNTAAGATAAGASTSAADSSDDSSSDDDADAASSLGAYVMTANTPLSPPLNSYLVEYNSWLHRALNARDLSPVPCTLIGPLLLQESDELFDVRSRRLAVPLAEVRWEREGVGGVVTKDGKSYVETGRRRKDGPAAQGRMKRLTAGQAAVRRTAMLTVVQLVQGLEHLLRETSGKSQDEWDAWLGKMMNDLMRENGANCGECLEVGAWWARKKGKR